ncbi:MAG TPA: O-antigen ligase family protein [Dyella sp.]|uniref:O-antigen ligase family protein n=1 Tax=Dyella sp. TaxID=1869338 RepID=UPI002B9D5D1A|nr:O-antigen ligase family protein [Dyella sp.]HUB90164.1 O-antigen ligase family protein [Dyella sp.]
MHEQTHPSQKRYWILSILLACMPLCFAVPYKAKVLLIAVLWVSGLVLLATRRDIRQIYGRIGAIALVCVLNILYTAVNIASHHSGWAAFDMPSQELLFLGMAAVFALPLRWSLVWVSFSLTACLLGGTSVVQYYLNGVDRPYGLNNGEWGAIEFAMFLLVLALLAVIQLMRKQTSRPERVVHALGAGLAVYGALLSQSRGPLLAFLAIFIVLMLIHGKRVGQWRLTLSVVAVLFTSVALVSVFVQPQIIERFAQAHTEADSYDSRHDAVGSVRERLELWRTAKHAFEEHPLGGVGSGQFGQYVREQVRLGHSNESIVQYEHAHNEYLEAAATGGIPGLILIVLLLGVPLVYFLRHVMAADEGTAAAAMCGFAASGTYALCALTDNVFYRAMPHSLYFFLVIGLAVLVARRRRSA